MCGTHGRMGSFPEKRRRYSAHGKVMYQDADILSKDVVEKFEKDFDLVLRYLHGRALGKSSD
jgi:hypothetical protein